MHNDYVMFRYIDEFYFFLQVRVCMNWRVWMGK